MSKKSHKFLSILKSKLAVKFAFRVVGIGILIALIISSLTIYLNYKMEVSKLNHELIQLERSLKNSFDLNMWQLNTKALNIMVNDLIRDKNIVYVKLLDENGNVYAEKGMKPKKDFIKKAISLYYNYNGKKYYLGKLIYFATTKNIYNEHKRFIVEAIVAITIFSIILCLVILYIYWETTIRHILAIKHYADDIRVHGYKKKKTSDLILNKRRGKEKDELDALVNSINEMHRELIERYTTIEYQSLHDSLTGLPNRRMINKLLKEIIENCQKNNNHGALFYIDLDDFKLINESMGHTVGDRILCEVADRLKGIGKEYLQAARISGDEFIVLQVKTLPNKHDTMKIAEKVATKVLSAISKPIVIEDYYFRVGASIGISLFGPKSSPEIVIKQADNALYHAKRKGRSQIEFFRPEMQQIRDKQLHIELLLDMAIEEDLIFMNYQPKYDINGKIKSAESLVRMRDEKWNIIPPGDFIPILEESGAIVEIGDHIIKKVFDFINRHRKEVEKSEIESIAINVSPVQYNSPGFSERVIMLSKQYNIDPKLIIFEITEEVTASNIDHVVDVMRQLTGYGFSFSIDDFGTGYSSMRYLKNLPLKELKVDKFFIDEITTNDKTKAIVKTIIDMAHNLGLDIVAEGVENEEQIKILAELKCYLYQGYFFSKPLTEEDFLSVLKSS